MQFMQVTLDDILPACGHHIFTDALFLQGYNSLLEGDLTNKEILEVCCGVGDLAGWVGRVSPAEVVGIDNSADSIRTATQKYGHLPNVAFKCADALQLSDFSDGAFDIVVGQAAMHHLAHDLSAASKEYSRVLKPGGKLIFIFEPL